MLRVRAGKDARDQDARGSIQAADDEIAFENAMVVTPADATTYFIVTIGLLAVASVASLVPAMRATRVDPLASMRAE